VLENITYQVNANDIQNMSLSSTSSRIRTRLLIYNEQGLKVNDGSLPMVQYLENYETTMKVTGLQLPDGNYTFVAITDIVQIANGRVQDEIWGMTGEDKITTLKLTLLKTHYENVSDFVHTKAILGIGTTKISVPTKSGNITIKPAMAGSLMVFNYNGIDRFGEITQYGILTDWISGYVSFDRDGNRSYVAAHPAVVQGNLEYGYVDYIPMKSEVFKGQSRAVSYFFTFPSSSGTNNFRFVYDGVAKAAVPYKLEIGGEYEFLVDLTSANDIKDVKPVISKKN
jgi:hypothetical protein